MNFVHPPLTELFYETEFEIKYNYIGNFHANLSHLQTCERLVVLDRAPFLLNDRSNYILLNKNDEFLISSLKSTKTNCKVLTYEVTKTNLSENIIKDSFELIDIKNTNHKDLEVKIKNLIINENQALNYLCKSKQNQLGYINNNFLRQKISTQTLSRINKEIDLELCKKIIIQRKLFEVEEDKLQSILDKIKRNNRRYFLYEIISILKNIDIKKICDVELLCDYIIKENLRQSDLSKIYDLFNTLYDKLKSPIPITKLFRVISEIESKRKDQKKGYNFFIDSWIKKDSDKEKIINYLIEHMKFINEQ